MSSLYQEIINPVKLRTKSSQEQILKSQLFQMYEQRLKSLIQTNKIYQETILKDNQQGALSFMNTQQMKNYRIERQLELLKDTLLIEKQQIIIKVLTTYHQLKKDHQKLQTNYNQLQQQRQKLKSQHQVLKKSNQQLKFVSKNIPQKDLIIKPSQKSRISLLSSQTEINSTSISLYEKMLQQKLILVKELQKKNKTLKEQNQEKSQKLKILQQKLKQSLSFNESLKQCKKCTQNEQTIKKVQHLNTKLSVQNDQLKRNLNKVESKLKFQEEEARLKGSQIKKYESQNQVLRNELKTYKEKQQSVSAKQNKPSSQSNLQTIKQLKQKLFLQQQQLMTLTNSFDFLKQDLNQSLLNEVKRLKNSHQLLQQNIKTSLSKLKTQIVTFVNQIIQTVRIKCQNKKNHDQLFKRLRKFDNQLDFFLQQNNINN